MNQDKKKVKTQLLEQLMHQAHVWFCVPEAISDSAQIAYCQSLLSKEETSRAGQFKFAEDKYNYLISHALVRLVLSQYADVEPSAWEFESNGNGRPEIKQGSCDLPLQFNLTHTDGLCACVVTLNRSCGIDVENTSRELDYMKVAERMFGESEIEQFRALSGDALKSMFFKYWTLREAYTKALGTVLAGSAEKFHFTINPVNESEIAVNHTHELAHKAKDWQFELSKPINDYQMAVSLQTGGQELEIISREFIFK